jgi:uncharacterized protein (TIGR03083 family)
MSHDLDYLAHLARESARFGEAMRETPSHVPVPTCPDWNADDLLWHLGEVQWFWGTIVREKVTGSQAEQLKPLRPADRAGLLNFFEHASHELADALAAATPESHAWTWSEDQTVGFIRRRQAHEALIHRVDAELTAGERTPMDADLSADGVDEALRIMYGGSPSWGVFTPDPGKSLTLQATDTGGSWLVMLGRFTGTDPDDHTSYDEPDIHTADDSHEQSAAAFGGTAADLDCWLWHRPNIQPIGRSGDRDVLDSFQSIIAPGIN